MTRKLKIKTEIKSIVETYRISYVHNKKNSRIWLLVLRFVVPEN